MPSNLEFTPGCPSPIQNYSQVLLAHGGGGKLMHQLISGMFMPLFRNPWLETQHDASVFSDGGRRLAFTTDSYVVKPLFFPGGDLGSLAVHGTLNDLAMAGARPLYLSAAFIIEEGLPIETLWRIAVSMQRAAQVSGVHIITGDTKVVDKGKGDGLFINTAGIGILEHSLRSIHARSGRATPSWSAATWAVMALPSGQCVKVWNSKARSRATRRPWLRRCSPCCAPASSALLAGYYPRRPDQRAQRDRRKPLGLTLSTIEESIPVREDVRSACELLGLDPLQVVACEGRFTAFVPESEAERALALLRGQPVCTGACRIGTVTDQGPPRVLLQTSLGVQRILDMSSGEQLPRIC